MDDLEKIMGKNLADHAKKRADELRQKIEVLPLHIEVMIFALRKYPKLQKNLFSLGKTSNLMLEFPKFNGMTLKMRDSDLHNLFDTIESLPTRIKNVYTG